MLSFNHKEYIKKLYGIKEILRMKTINWSHDKTFLFLDLENLNYQKTTYET